MRHQQYGDLDDAKLVDALAGDRLVFRRRGTNAQTTPWDNHDADGDKRIKRLCTTHYHLIKQLVSYLCFADFTLLLTYLHPCIASTEKTGELCYDYVHLER